MAPTYTVNAVALLFMLSQVFGWNIPFTSAEVQNAVTVFVVLAAPIFTMIRQVVTGRATVLGAKGPAANAS